MSITVKNLHKDLPDDQIHEAKGHSTASNNTYLKKNHEGSSEWLSEYWLEPVLGVVSGASAPPTESTGNRYILTGASFHANWDSPAQHEIVEFNGTSWVGIAAVDGMRAVDLSDDSVYYFNTAWVQSGDTDTTYTAGDGLDLSGTEFSTDLKSNGGIVIESTELAVDLGASSITGTLVVGDGGTGASTLTANGVLIGNGTSAVAAVDMSTKGHILIGDGSGNPQMLAIGDDDQVLTADSGETTGVKWAAAGGGGGDSDIDGLSDAKLYNNTTAAQFSVFIGNGADADGGTPQHGTLGTGAISNLAMMGHALKLIADGAQKNIAIGYNAMTALTSTDRNIAIGDHAGKDNTANDCVFIGSRAGYGHSTGDYNVAIGTNAMDATGTQQRNVAIGYDALGLCTGNHNTAVGFDAGDSIAGGQQNVCLGYEAGEAITSGSYNTSVGTKSDCAATVSNQIAIGNTAVTTGQYGIAIGDNVSAAGDDAVIGRSGNTITCDFDTDGTWTQSSDERKKNVIGADDLGLDFINDLQTKTYTWKPSEEHLEAWGNFGYEQDENGDNTEVKVYSAMNTDTVMHGLIAQEVKVALDAAGCDTFGGWSEDDNGQQHVSKSMFVIPLIKAVQELAAKVEALENA